MYRRFMNIPIDAMDTGSLTCEERYKLRVLTASLLPQFTAKLYFFLEVLQLVISKSLISASVHFLYDLCLKGIALFYSYTVLNSVELCALFVLKKCFIRADVFYDSCVPSW